MRTEPGLEIGGRERDQRRHVGDKPPNRCVLAPDAFPGRGIAPGKAASVKGQGPAVLLGKRGKALHRRPFKALGDHLVEAEQAAVAGPLAVGEGDRRRVELGEFPGRPFALGAVARRAMLGIERAPRWGSGRLAGASGTG